MAEELRQESKGGVFLYKPAFLRDAKIAQDLEFYIQERQEELSYAGVAQVYENYWRARNVIKTNIYGAIPVSMLTDEQSETLQRYGWRIAETASCAVYREESVESQIDTESDNYIVFQEHDDNMLTIVQFNFVPLCWEYF